MNGIYSIILMLIGLGVTLVPFIEGFVLRPHQREKLEAKFKEWWELVEHYNKLELALIFAKKGNGLLTYIFGDKLFSYKALIRCLIISNGLFIMAMAWVGLIDGETFGVTPWNNYKSSVVAAESVLDSFTTNANFTMFAEASITNVGSANKITNALSLNTARVFKQFNVVTNQVLLTIDTNSYLMTYSRDAVVTIDEIQPLGHGNLYTQYRRQFNVDTATNITTNAFGNIRNSINPYVELLEDAKSARKYIEKHDSIKAMTIYSIVYFLIVILSNMILFYASLVFCRIMLKEIYLSGRLVSGIALVITDLVAFCFCSALVLFLFIILAVPLLWLFCPSLLIIADDSLYTFGVFLMGCCLTAVLLSGTSAKLIVLIAFLPNVFAAFIGIVSVIAIKWKTRFHGLSKWFLIRFVEHSPLKALMVILFFGSAVLAVVAHMLHLSAYF